MLYPLSYGGPVAAYRPGGPRPRRRGRTRSTSTNYDRTSLIFAAPQANGRGVWSGWTRPGAYTQAVQNTDRWPSRASDHVDGDADTRQSPSLEE